ncbi:MAG TPA: sugar transferase, partial [Chitinophaga sp.]
MAEHPENTISVSDLALGLQTLKVYLQKGVKPQYIVCSVPEDMQKMESFVSFLQRNHRLRHVPLFFYKDELSIAEREQIRKLGRVDDILVSTTTTAAFQEKLQFAIRLHAHAVQAVADRRRLTWKAVSRVINMIAKRTFDIVCAGTALILVSPIMLIIAILIRLESKGPIFYVARRAGSRYKVFEFYKFRTMVVDADKQ